MTSGAKTTGLAKAATAAAAVLLAAFALLVLATAGPTGGGHVDGRAAAGASPDPSPLGR